MGSKPRSKPVVTATANWNSDPKTRLSDEALGNTNPEPFPGCVCGAHIAPAHMATHQAGCETFQAKQ